MREKKEKRKDWAGTERLACQEDANGFLAKNVSAPSKNRVV